MAQELQHAGGARRQHVVVVQVSQHARHVAAGRHPGQQRGFLQRGRIQRADHGIAQQMFAHHVAGRAIDVLMFVGSCQGLRRPVPVFRQQHAAGSAAPTISCSDSSSFKARSSTPFRNRPSIVEANTVAQTTSDFVRPAAFQLGDIFAQMELAPRADVARRSCSR